MRHLVLVAAVCLGLGTYTLPACAGIPVDAAGAATLKAELDKTAASYTAAAKTLSEGVTIGGDVQVKPLGAYYEVKAPNVVLKRGDMDVHLGDVLIYAVPAGQGLYRTTLALPGAVSLYDPDGRVRQAEVKLGKQRFSGIWNSALHSFTAIDSEYDNMVMTWVNGTDARLEAGSLKGLLDLKQNADKTWSGPASAVLKNVKLAMTTQSGSKMTATADNWTTRISYDRLDMNVVTDIRNASMAFLEKSGPGQQPAPDRLRAFSEEVLKKAALMVDGTSTGLTVAGFKVDIQPAPANKEGKPVTFTLAKLDTLFSLSRARQEKGAAALLLAAAGFDVRPLDAALAGSLPRAAKLDISFADVPLQALSKISADFFRAAMKSGLDAGGKTAEARARDDQEMANILMIVPSLLANAGTSVSVRDTYIKSRDMTTMMDGTVRMQSALTAGGGRSPFTGTVNVVIQGIDEIVAKLQAESKTSAATPETVQYLQGLGVLQLLGQPDKAANGQSLRKYLIAMSPEGRLTLNGADLNGAMQLLSPTLPGPR